MGRGIGKTKARRQPDQGGFYKDMCIIVFGTIIRKNFGLGSGLDEKQGLECQTVPVGFILSTWVIAVTNHNMD